MVNILSGFFYKLEYKISLAGNFCMPLYILVILFILFSSLSIRKINLEFSKIEMIFIKFNMIFNNNKNMIDNKYYIKLLHILGN